MSGSARRAAPRRAANGGEQERRQRLNFVVVASRMSSIAGAPDCAMTDIRKAGRRDQSVESNRIGAIAPD